MQVAPPLGVAAGGGGGGGAVHLRDHRLQREHQVSQEDSRSLGKDKTSQARKDKTMGCFLWLFTAVLSSSRSGSFLLIAHSKPRRLPLYVTTHPPQ